MSFSPLFADSTSPQDKDLATLSNYVDIRATHIDLVWRIDWEAKVIGGSATVKLEATKDVEDVVLDTSYLDVKDVEVEGSKAVGRSSGACF
jgi:leukotriene-A4 hydrolase